MIAVDTLLPWLLPPLLGAAIGYVTNSVAIRMLFRPLHELRLFGVRVPFTPGVIPRRRHELAASIADMVARELLTPEVFSVRLSAPQVSYTLRHAVANSVSGLVERGIGNLDEKEAIHRAVERVVAILRQTLCSDPNLIDTVRNRIISELGETQLAEFESVWRGELIHEIIPMVLKRLRSPLIDYLERPEIRQEIDRRILSLLHYAFDRLGTVQRLMVTAAQFDRQIEQNIPQLRQRLVSEVGALLTDDRVSSSLSESFLLSLENRRHLKLRELLGEDGSTLLSMAMRNVLTGKQCEDIIARVSSSVHQIVDEGLANTSFGAFLLRRRGAIAALLVNAGRRTILRRLPSMVDALDIRRVVVDRIDSLAVDRVEALLLGIIRRHLRWINLFGALIGALIGGVQIVLRLLGYA